MKRFVKEFASYKKTCITSNDLMSSDIKQEKLLNIDRMLSWYKRYLITENEIMQRIAEI